MLYENGFLQVGRSDVVNLKYVRSIRNYKVELRSGVELSVSRQYYTAIRSAWLEWKGQFGDDEEFWRWYMYGHWVCLTQWLGFIMVEYAYLGKGRVKHPLVWSGVITMLTMTLSVMRNHGFFTPMAVVYTLRFSVHHSYAVWWHAGAEIYRLSDQRYHVPVG